MSDPQAVDLSDFAMLEGSGGLSLGVSRWFDITQSDIDMFGEVTHDRDAMHMDPAWAAEHSPYGTTIAYGFQTLSMLTAMLNDMVPRGTREAYKINYGFDRIRLMAPVPAGSRIRGTAVLRAVRLRDADSHVVTAEITVEIEGAERPALVADWLFLVVNAERGKRRPDMNGEAA